MVKKSGPGSGMNHPGSYFLELRNHFFGLKYRVLKFLDADLGSGMEKNSDPRSGMEKSRIRDRKKSDPGSGIGKNIPDPQHWS
jgi:hypothetical protein